MGLDLMLDQAAEGFGVAIVLSSKTEGFGQTVAIIPYRPGKSTLFQTVWGWLLRSLCPICVPLRHKCCDSCGSGKEGAGARTALPHSC
jgi:hypothetical protein